MWKRPANRAYKGLEQFIRNTESGQKHQTRIAFIAESMKNHSVKLSPGERDSNQGPVERERHSRAQYFWWKRKYAKEEVPEGFLPIAGGGLPAGMEASAAFAASRGKTNGVPTGEN